MKYEQNSNILKNIAHCRIQTAYDEALSFSEGEINLDKMFETERGIHF